MINSLRKKFILTSITAITVVLIIIIATINVINHFNMKKTLDVRIDILLENDGRFPDDRMKFEDKPPQMEMRELPKEAAFDTRFYMAKVADDGKIIDINLDRIASVSEESARESVEEVYKKGTKKGFYGTYRYKKAIDSQGNIEYVFIDAEREISSFKTFLIASIGISLFGVLLFASLVILFSKIIMKPIFESYEKQKRFITDASHEIKTPLAIISANNEVLEMDYGENQWTKSTENQVTRLKELTDKLVFLSKMDEGSLKVEISEFDINEMLHEEITLFETVAASMNKTLIYNSGGKIKLNANVETIRQLIGIMLDNAIKYSEDEDKVEINCKKDIKTGKYVKLEFINRAKGFEKGKQEQLFDRFYRADKSRNQKTGGHGIGLSVAEAIVGLHKGKISAYSDGSKLTFTILLPIK